MRIAILLASLGGLLLGAAEPRFAVVDDWGVHGTDLRLGCIAWPIRLAEVARRLGIAEESVPEYLRGLDPERPLLIEQDAGNAVVGIRPLTAELLSKELRVELKLPKDAKAGEPMAFEVRLVNDGKAAHRVVKPNDGSESGWREPEVYFEREIDGAWVRGSKPGRCGLFATDWHKDIVELKPGDALPLEGYLSPEMSFDLRNQ
jgi:hypothetical protein